jgi:hypothetical protein
MALPSCIAMRRDIVSCIMPMRLILVLLLASPLFTPAQGWDMVLLKRHDKTLNNYMPGKEIMFRMADGRFASGMIKKIERDTIFLAEYDIRKAYNMWGTMALDTVSAYLNAYAYKDVSAIMRPSQGFEFIKDGSLFMIGGAVYMLLHVVNSAIQKAPLDPKALAISGGFIAGGWVMHKLRKHEYRLGEKYHLEYLPVSAK